LAKEGVNVTATGIYTTMQGVLAVLAGAKYIAIYYNRMEDNCTDADRVIEQIRSFIDESGSSAKILAASFKNVAEIVSAFASGAHSATVSYSLIKKALSLPSIDSAVDVFRRDFEEIHGEGQTMATILKKD
ncbi:MAG: fructose-bisphosphate aldolase, partial [Clostridia bacterium]|nr:fructose-bisphosphate aldolase [Clostridia bacterium]